MSESKGRKNRIVIRASAFLLGLAALLCLAQRVFTNTEFRIYQSVEGFFAEEDRPLDAVYIGASNVFASWQAPLGWERYGYAVYPLAFSSMPLRAARYIIEEARKTQPDALYIISLNNTKRDSLSAGSIHYITDFLPWSHGKARLINALCDQAGIQGMDRLEFFFPFVRYHAFWDELQRDALLRSPDRLKGALHAPYFMEWKQNVSDAYTQTTAGEDLTETIEETLQDLLDYCREEQIDVLFTVTPQVNSQEQAGRINAAAAMVEQAGFPVLNMLTDVDEIGLDLAGDFYNDLHMNVHGSSKFVWYFGRYLQEHYDFTDKRGQAAYSDWDDAAAQYREIADNYLLDIELDGADRDGTLAKPLMLLAELEDGAVSLQWSPCPGADGYTLYRQALDAAGVGGDWEALADVDGTAWQDGTAGDGTWRYTVVPWTETADSRAYGPFDSEGILVGEQEGGGA